MKSIPTPISGLIVLQPTIHYDHRGYFYESYNQKILKDLGITEPFVQDNQSHSQYGTLRGLHFQTSPYAQAKLIRVISGSIWDVAIDLRCNSPTFLQHFSIELSSENQLQLYIPKEFAHGFVVTSKTATIIYKCDQFYMPSYEQGIHYADPTLKIDWPIPPGKLVVSSKDLKLPFYQKNQYV